MNTFQKFSIVAFTLLIIGMGAFSAFANDDKKAAAADNTVIDQGWAVRCPDKAKSADKKACEIFNRLVVKSSSLRLVEFAVGFPQDKDMKKGTARGVIILPLGILLQPGATMKVDDGKPFGFNSRFCTTGGCFSVVNLDATILDTMKKGKTLNIFFKTSNNQDVHLIMDLSGFDKKLADLG